MNCFVWLNLFTTVTSGVGFLEIISSPKKKVPGSIPHLIFRRWLSQHRCLVVNFNAGNLCPEFGSVSLVLHSSGYLLLSYVNPSNTLDQCTIMIDYQNLSSGFVRSVWRCDEQTAGAIAMDLLQPRDQVVDKTSCTR